MDLHDFGPRLQALEDLEAIKNLHREYVYLLNARLWEEVIDCFTDDAKIQIFYHPRCNGKGEIREMFLHHMSKVNSGKGRDGHFATMPVIKLDGERGSGHWMLYILIADPVTGNALKWTQGRYECQYVKTNGKWKFSKLVWVNPWPRQPESKPSIEDVQSLGFDF